MLAEKYKLVATMDIESGIKIPDQSKFSKTYGQSSQKVSLKLNKGKLCYCRLKRVHINAKKTEKSEKSPVFEAFQSAEISQHILITN